MSTSTGLLITDTGGIKVPCLYSESEVLTLRRLQITKVQQHHDRGHLCPLIGWCCCTSLLCNVRYRQRYNNYAYTNNILRRQADNAASYTTLEEQCTFRGYLDTACPDNTYVIFSRCNGDDWDDTGWEIIDDEELVRHLEEGLANFVWEESSPGVASFDYNDLKVEKSIWDKDTWWESRITINNVQ